MVHLSGAFVNGHFKKNDPSTLTTHWIDEVEFIYFIDIGILMRRQHCGRVSNIGDVVVNIIHTSNTFRYCFLVCGWIGYK